MKILIIMNDLDIGGAQTYTINLMNKFVQKGHSVSIRILSNNLLLKNRISSKISMVVWNRRRKLDLLVLNKIRKEVKVGNYDAIISSYVLYQKLATIFLKRDAITIYPLHFTTERNKKSFILNFILFRLKHKKDIYITSINNQTDYISKHYKLDKNILKQIYNGVDSDKFTLIPEKFSRTQFLKSLGINPHDKIILMVAGFREEKRHIDAFCAFKLLLKENENITLLCVGDNNIIKRDELKKFLEDHEIVKAKLLIASEAGDINKYYWSSQLFTLTSNKVETFPISALEAMASGLPCVLTNIGGAKDLIINEFNGKVCEANNIQDIKTKWAEVLNNYKLYNKDAIRKMVVENYSITKSATEYINIITTHQNNVV